VRKLAAAIGERMKAAQERLGAAFDGSSRSADELARLLPLLGEMRFYRRFLDEASAIEEEAEEALLAAEANGEKVHA